MIGSSREARGGPQPVDLIVRTQAALPMTSETVVYDAMIAIKDGRIAFVGPAE
jgi:imidazolonepropionase-like amidohydrolase